MTLVFVSYFRTVLSQSIKSSERPSPKDPQNEGRIRQSNVLILRKADFGHGFPGSPRVDFGRYIKRDPWFVLKPATVDGLRSCVTWLSIGGLLLKFVVRAFLRGPGVDR
jgi:hypothetical protein